VVPGRRQPVADASFSFYFLSRSFDGSALAVGFSVSFSRLLFFDDWFANVPVASPFRQVQAGATLTMSTCQVAGTKVAYSTGQTFDAQRVVRTGNICLVRPTYSYGRGRELVSSALALAMKQGAKSGTV
jgi:hypothetical protein